MANEMVNVKYEDEYIVNSRGLKLFTCRWLPTHCEPKALVFLCHGYAMECSISMRDAGMQLAGAGYAVHGMDYEGHGKSSGLAGYVPDFRNIIDDCTEHYTSICERKENQKKLRMLLGESMGGAVALLMHRKLPEFWDGTVLVAPMCKIADDMKPSPMVIKVLNVLSYVIPTWKITPTQDVIDVAFRLPKVREEIRSNPYCYKGRPRLKTGQELLAISMDLENRLQEVSLPFIVLHGEADKVTDPAVSKILYETATSADKTIKLYPGMWHALTYGELPENIDIVFSDIIGWLNERTCSDNSNLEIQQKATNDNKEFKDA